MDRRSLLRAGALAGLLAACRQAPSASGPGTSGPSATGPATSAPSTPPSPRPAPTEPTPSPAPTAEPVRAPLLCRDAWQAAPADGGGRTHTITGLMVHHSAVALEDNREAPSRMRGYQRYHQEQGWPDVAYHVGVDANGHLYELRDPALAGDTFTDYDPAGWLLVLADGNFDEQDPTAAQLEGVAQVLAWGAGRFGTSTQVAAHRDHAQTSCPGDALYTHVADGALQARVEELLATGGVALDRVCGPDAAAVVAAIEAGER